MATTNNRLEQFFLKHKRNAFNALARSNKWATSKKEAAYALSDQKRCSLQSTLKERAKNLIHSLTPPSFIPIVVAAQTPLKQGRKKNELVQKKRNKSLENRAQFVSKSLKLRKQTVSLPLANCKQIVSDPLENPLAKKEEKVFTDLRDFSEKERSLLTLIFWQCHHNGSLFSPPISTEEICHTLKISVERARNLIFRITQKGGVKVTQRKSGQNAYRVFELPKSLYQWMIDQQNNRGVRLPEPLANPLANSLYSNSSLINKKTTNSLPEDWKKINYEPLVEFGFSETQLQQLYETHATMPEIIQESIHHFAYGLEYNEKTKAYKKKDPLNVLMGVLRKGQSWNEANYISKKELALKKILEEKKKEKERYNLMIKELVDIEFPMWRKKLSPSEIRLIVPEETLRVNLAPAITACLRIHYLEKILLPRLERDEASQSGGKVK
ncbi:MAG: hypothetical protein K0R24_357 [Gammaproteobacteria bacterium]|jgi:hypothetical protein|nr:hypothetical protein [Gammaproteobacteria bacterium]